MVEGADVMTELSPCLSAANVNNSAKLAKQLPDGVSADTINGLNFLIFNFVLITCKVFSNQMWKESCFASVKVQDVVFVLSL